MSCVRLWALLSGACLMILASCASRPPVAYPPPAPSTTQAEERLGVDDVFEVRVAGEQDLTGAYRVGADGTIDYPYIGRIQVLGMRSGELQELITTKLKDGFLRSPQVSVMVKEWNSRKIVVLGQVQKPGPVIYHPQMTIVDAVAAAGGFTGIAAKNSVRLRREINGKVESNVYRVADIMEARSANISLLPGDVIVVEERMF
jgi:protein involved in polysaccharide export with SLBB domain